jgi:hypothetical protein
VSETQPRGAPPIPAAGTRGRIPGAAPGALAHPLPALGRRLGGTTARAPPLDQQRVGREPATSVARRCCHKCSASGLLDSSPPSSRFVAGGRGRDPVSSNVQISGRVRGGLRSSVSALTVCPDGHARGPGKRARPRQRRRDLVSAAADQVARSGKAWLSRSLSQSPLEHQFPLTATPDQRSWVQDSCVGWFGRARWALRRWEASIDADKSYRALHCGFPDASASARGTPILRRAAAWAEQRGGISKRSDCRASAATHHTFPQHDTLAS